MVKKTTYLIVGILSVIVVGSSSGVGLYFGLNKQTKLFIAIHCEPGSFPLTTTYQEQYWPSLVTMMSHAKANNVKLNLLFNPQWGSYILPNTSRFTLLRAWESNGHEIGLHVHGAHMGSWCGYTNQPGYETDPKYIGTITDMMVLMNQLPASGLILTTCSANDEDINYDYPAGVTHSTFGGSEKINHLWSKPEIEEYNGQTTDRVSHARYGPLQSDVNLDLDEFKELFKARNKENIMGLVWHVFNFDDNPLPYIQLFEYLNAQEIKTWSVSEL